MAPAQRRGGLHAGVTERTMPHRDTIVGEGHRMIITEYIFESLSRETYPVHRTAGPRRGRGQAAGAGCTRGWVKTVTNSSLLR